MEEKTALEEIVERIYASFSDIVYNNYTINENNTYLFEDAKIYIMLVPSLHSFKCYVKIDKENKELTCEISRYKEKINITEFHRGKWENYILALRVQILEEEKIKEEKKFINVSEKADNIFK